MQACADAAAAVASALEDARGAVAAAESRAAAAEENAQQAAAGATTAAAAADQWKRRYRGVVGPACEHCTQDQCSVAGLHVLFLMGTCCRV